MSTSAENDNIIREINENFVAPTNADDIFEKFSDMEPKGSKGQFEYFVVKKSLSSLERGQVLPIFDGTDDFPSLILSACAQVYEVAPLILELILIITTSTVMPKYITLDSIKVVFVFNGCGIANLPPTMKDKFSFPAIAAVGQQMHSAQAGSMNTPPPLAEPQNKARQNACKVQNLRVLFLQNTQGFRSIVGYMEDLTQDRVISALRGKLSNSLKELVMMQSQNVKCFLGLMFQHEGPDLTDVKKGVVSVLHLNYFRTSTAPMTTSVEVKDCFKKMVAVLRETVGADSRHFLNSVFADIVFQLDSEEEDSLCQLDSKILLEELSSRLAKFSLVLEEEGALDLSEADLKYQLQDALDVDMRALNDRDVRDAKVEMRNLCREFREDNRVPKRPRLEQTSQGPGAGRGIAGGTGRGG